MDDIQSTPRNGEPEESTPAPKRKGGARPGSGRPRKVDREAIQRAKAEAESRVAGTVIAKIEEIEREADRLATIAEVEAKIGTKVLALVDRLVELSEGVTVQETDRHGETKIYTRPPDRDATRYLLDRFMGRIAERAEMMPKQEGDAERTKLPTPEELLHQVVQMLLAMHRQAGQTAQGAASGAVAPIPQIEAPASEAEGGAQ